jgi:2-methylcitrate dehydratase PrpD
MDTTRRLVEFCQSLSYESLPPAVVEMVRYLALDFVGVATRGSLEDSSQAMFSFITDRGLDPHGGIIIGTDMRAPYQYAALGNGTSAHSLEFDDFVNEGSVHVGVAVFPAAFAAAEMTGSTGRRFVEAVVSGYEVMVRLGKGLNPPAHYARGFHATGTCGGFGAAIAASKILGLSTEETLNALGIVGSQAAGSMEYLTNGSWTKRFHAGWAAHNGLIAALLAKKGFTGPSTIVEGRFGFLTAYSDNSHVDRVLAALGEPFEITRTSVKPHACCRLEHASIDGILKLIQDNDLAPQQIDNVVLGFTRTHLSIVAEPPERKYSPRTVVDAQFSMPFTAALAILCGRVSLDGFAADKLDSPEIKEMASRIRCVVDPEVERGFPKQWGATVEVRTRDGRQLHTKIEYPKGDPENALSWDELIGKFYDISSSVFSEDRRAEIVSRIRSIEKESIPNLTRLFRRAHEA